MTDKSINKAAYKQAALQIAAGIRRLERAGKGLIKISAPPQMLQEVARK